MHRHAPGQRKHIVSEISLVLLQFIVYSFFLYPSLLDLFLRLIAITAARQPAAIAPGRSLSVWSLFICGLHASSLVRPLFALDTSKGIVLDFIGNDRMPSRLLLAAVTVFVLFLNCILLAIEYELSYPPAENPSSMSNTEKSSSYIEPAADSGDLVIDFRFRNAFRRLRGPAPPPPQTAADLQLPLPNNMTTNRQANRIARALQRALARQMASTQQGQTLGAIPGSRTSTTAAT
ncbi:hypothetical protein BKA62DRAFT_710357 [Auriculariales sp. MPI-PUGE-AT-0066]|nr:hypothetical protein BKA62DRAFT_710357 [Auriculariales sp. MPI-PUGE-AT-0066]